MASDLDSLQELDQRGGGMSRGGAARRMRICDMVRNEGYVPIDALARRFDVTPQTIRRDINALAEEGLLQRHHGGAGLPSTIENLAYRTRQSLFAEAKRRIAQLAAQQIPDGASLFLNIGTTTEEVAKALIHHKNLSVITNNLNVAAIFSDVESGDVTIAGGLVRKRDRGIMGEATLDFIRQFKVDFGVIGISGIELDGSLLDFDYREVQVAKAIIANARQIILVADHTKFGRSAMVRVGSVAQVDALITDRSPPPALTEVLAEKGTRLYIADAA